MLPKKKCLIRRSLRECEISAIIMAAVNAPIRILDLHILILTRW